MTLPDNHPPYPRLWHCKPGSTVTLQGEHHPRTILQFEGKHVRFTDGLLTPLTNKEKVYRWRRRLKQRDPEAYELLMARSIARIYAHKAKTGRHDPIMAALYGQATHRNSA